jgi:hypothetical protein
LSVPSFTHRKCTRTARPLLLLSLVCVIAIPIRSAWSAPEAVACAANQPARELDYWLGDWAVGYSGASSQSVSHVGLELDKCLLVETWNDGKGHSGKNFFGYSADDRAWRGLFADNRGRLHVFVDGKVSRGSAEFLGPSRDPGGRSVINRMRVIRLGADQLTQSWEKSTDDGVTWTSQFTLSYSRKSP